MPFVLDVLATIVTGPMQPTMELPVFIGPLSLVYGILMHARNRHLSAYQRLNTIIAVKGNMNDQVHLLQLFLFNVIYCVILIKHD